MYEADRRERQYNEGVASFVRAATAYKSNEGKEFIGCPCVDCKNEKEFSNIEVIRAFGSKRFQAVLYPLDQPWRRGGNA